MISLVTEHCDHGLVAVDCSNAENTVSTIVDAPEDLIVLAHEENAVENNQDLVTPNTEVAVENQETAALKCEVDAPGKNIQPVGPDEVADAAKNIEVAMSENVSDITNILEAVVQSGKYKAMLNNLEAVIATEPASDIIDPTHNALLTDVMTPEVGKCLQEIKEILEEVRDRLNALDALLHKN